MALDQSLKRKRGRPVGSKSAKSSNGDGLQRKRGRHVGSISAESKMEQKMALVQQRIALLDSSSGTTITSESDKDDDYKPMNEELGALRVVEDEEMYLERDMELTDVHCVRDGIRINRAKVSNVSRQKIDASSGSAMARAEDVQAKLPAQHPSFIKGMLKSHVIHGFWLGLPAKFCNKHLPMSDTVFVLEDENGNKYETTYLAAKQGLSAGWRGFALKHFLKVGDVVLFQVVGLGSKIEPPKFKVYIIKADELTAADGAVGLLNLEMRKEEELSKEGSAGGLTSTEDPEVDTVCGNVPLIDTNGIVREAIEGIRMVDSDIEFEDVSSFSIFNIIVDGLVIDCKFEVHMRRTYYELCRSQKSFLHKRLLKQLNLSLVVGVIMETVSIAEGIKAWKAEASCREDFLVWKKTLESFELLGMDVGFLLKRVNALLSLQAQSRNLSECRKELRVESARAAEKVKALELQLSGVKDVLQKVDADMQEVEFSARKSKVALQELATAPW